jgi:hypothetical protein
MSAARKTPFSESASFFCTSKGAVLTNDITQEILLECEAWQPRIQYEGAIYYR